MFSLHLIAIVTMYSLYTLYKTITHTATSVDVAFSLINHGWLRPCWSRVEQSLRAVAQQASVKSNLTLNSCCVPLSTLPNLECGTSFMYSFQYASYLCLSWTSASCSMFSFPASAHVSAFCPRTCSAGRRGRWPDQMKVENLSEVDQESSFLSTVIPDPLCPGCPMVLFEESLPISSSSWMEKIALC